MKRLVTFLMMISIIFVISSSISTAQTDAGIIGKKFTRNDANVLFGKVTNSVQVSKEEIAAAVSKARKNVYFVIRNNQVYVLSDRRLPLNTADFTWERGTVAYVFSKSIVEDFLNNTKSRILNFELRSSKQTSIFNKSGQVSTTLDDLNSVVFTISSDSETLEMSLPCPPICE